MKIVFALYLDETEALIKSERGEVGRLGADANAAAVVVVHGLHEARANALIPTVGVDGYKPNATRLACGEANEARHEHRDAEAD